METTNSTILLGTESIKKLLAQYAIPAIIAMTAASLYNITDSIFIGHGVGPLAISGLAITFPLMNLANAFGALVGVGGATLLSVRLGQKDYDTSNHILGNVVVLNCIIGISFTLVSLLFLDPILFFFGASKATIPYAREFMQIILIGNVVTHLYQGLNALLRSSGDPKKAMYATIITVLINLVLNPLFIFGFGWGIRGSAFATVISQVVVLLWQISIFSNKSYFIHFKKGIFRLKSQIVKDILSIGLSPFLMNAAACVIVILINQGLTKYGGDLAVGAYGIVNRMSFLFFMIVMGLNQGMQPIVGYNYGAKQYSRMMEAFKLTTKWAIIVLTTGFILIELFPHTVASIFTSDKDLTDFAARGLRIVFIFFPIIGIGFVGSTFLQSVGMVKEAIFLSLLRQVIFLMPCLLILPHFFGVDGVWSSICVADFAATITSCIVLYYKIKQLKKQSLMS